MESQTLGSNRYGFHNDTDGDMTLKPTTLSTSSVSDTKVRLQKF